MGVTHEDWALHQSAQLCDYKIKTIPCPLFFYRVTQNSMIRTTDKYRNFRAQVEIFEKMGDEKLHNIGLLLEILQTRNHPKSITGTSSLPPVQHILDGVYDNEPDKVLLAFYKKVSRLAVILSKFIPHGSKIRKILSHKEIET